MREIEFRGKRIDNKEWIYGDLLQPTEICDIYEISDKNTIDGSRYDVDRETIGQYTGLKDKNGKKIFEEDICKYYNSLDKDGICIIENWNTSFVAKWIDETIQKTNLVTSLFYLSCGTEFEVIGNIIDNPELIEEGE